MSRSVTAPAPPTPADDQPEVTVLHRDDHDSPEVVATPQPDGADPTSEVLVTEVKEPEAEASPGRRRREALAEQTAALLQRMREAGDETERQRLVDEIVLINLPVARSLAMRYRERGVPVDDLMQVAALGLVKAAQGFDADRGRDFMAYAAPTITGEIKRHFRDTGWAVRPPRRLQELRTRVAQATQALSQTSGRAPTVKELAASLGVEEEDVVEAMVSSNGYATTSLDAPPDGERGSWADTVADADTTLASTPDRLALQQVLSKLPERERRILALRFFADKTQSEIGAEIGVTQMQVSRLLSRALHRLREQLEEPSDDGPG